MRAHDCRPTELTSSSATVEDLARVRRRAGRLLGRRRLDREPARASGACTASTAAARRLRARRGALRRLGRDELLVRELHDGLVRPDARAARRRARLPARLGLPALRRRTAAAAALPARWWTAARCARLGRRRLRALHFRGGEFVEAVALREARAGYRVEPGGETALTPGILRSASSPGSSSTGTPSRSAFSSLEPGEAPATT